MGRPRKYGAEWRGPAGEILRKECPGCGLVKDASDFHRSARKATGLTSRCKPCNAAYSSEKYYRDHEAAKSIGRARQKSKRLADPKGQALACYNSKIKRVYGINIGDYEAMYRRQMGLCKICKATLREGKERAIDHCHKTGAVRAILCGHCNRMLGQARDDARILRLGARYLDSFSSLTTKDK